MVHDEVVATQPRPVHVARMIAAVLSFIAAFLLALTLVATLVVHGFGDTFLWGVNSKQSVGWIVQWVVQLIMIVLMLALPVCAVVALVRRRGFFLCAALAAFAALANVVYALMQITLDWGIPISFSGKVHWTYLETAWYYNGSWNTIFAVLLLLATALFLIGPAPEDRSGVAAEAVPEAVVPEVVEPIAEPEPEVEPEPEPEVEPEPEPEEPDEEHVEESVEPVAPPAAPVAPSPVPPGPYFVYVEGAQHGPYSAEQIVAFVAEGRVGPVSWLRREDEQWHPAQSIPGLFG